MAAQKYYRNMPRPVDVKVKESSTGVLVSGPYHEKFATAAKNLGGKFDRGWMFPASVTSEVRRLAQRCYGEGDPDNTDDLTVVRIRAKRELSKRKAQVLFHNRVIATARGRDSNAAPGHEVSLLSENGISSGGSFINWFTLVDEDAEFEVRQFPRALATSNDDFEVIAIDGVTLNSAETE